MSDDKGKQEFNIGGNISGGNINIGGNQSFGDGAHIEYNEGAGKTNDELKQDIQALIDQLLGALQAELAPKDPEAAVEIKAEARKISEDLKAEAPDKNRLVMRGDDLLKAAKNIAAVTPAVLNIATQVVAAIGMLK